MASEAETRLVVKLADAKAHLSMLAEAAENVLAFRTRPDARNEELPSDLLRLRQVVRVVRSEVRAGALER